MSDHVHNCACIYIYTHARTHARTHAHTHTHTQVVLTTYLFSEPLPYVNVHFTVAFNFIDNLLIDNILLKYMHVELS